MVDGPPFAENVGAAREGVGPRAFSAVAVESGDVPKADGVGVADGFIVRDTTFWAAGGSLGSPFAFGIGVAWAVGTPAEEALVDAGGVVGGELALIGVEEADVDGEVLALLAALAELGDPSAGLAGVAGVGGDVDGARSIAELSGVIPHAEGVVVAWSADGVRELAGLNAAVDGSLEAGFIVDADVFGQARADVFADSKLDIPLTFCWVAGSLSLSGRAWIEHAGASAGFDAGRRGVAWRSDGRAAVVANAGVEDARDLGGAGSSREERTAVGAGSLGPHALGVGEATSFIGRDLGALGFAAADSGGPLAARVSVARRLNGVGDGALGLAGGGSGVPFADLEANFARRLRGLKLASSLAGCGEGVPHALIVVGAGLNVGEVAVCAFGATSGIAGVPLAVAVGQANGRVVVGDARDLAGLDESVPLALRLGVASRLGRHGLATHDAKDAGRIPLAEGVAVAGSLSLPLDGALGGADEEAGIPLADVLVIVAVGFSKDQAALDLARIRFGVPFAALVAVGVASGLGEITTRGAGSDARGAGDVAENVGSARSSRGVSSAVVFAKLQSVVPGALAVLVAVARSGGEPTILADGDALLGDNTRSSCAVGAGDALGHVHDGVAGVLADSGLILPLAVLEGVAARGGAGSVGATSLAAQPVDAHGAHGFGNALSDGEGVVDVDEDVGACCGASHDGGIPHAARVGNAGRLVGVHDGAVANTTEGGGVPCTERRADARVGVDDGETTNAAKCCLGVPFAIGIGIALIGRGAKFALELADASDAVGDTVVTGIAVAGVRALRVACLLRGTPAASGGGGARGETCDGGALGAANLIGHAPFAAVVALDVAAEEVPVDLRASGVASVVQGTDGEGSLGVREKLAGAVGLTVLEVECSAVSLAFSGGVGPEAVTGGSVGITRSLLLVLVLALLQASTDVDATGFDGAFEQSGDGAAEGRALHAAVIPDASNVGVALSLVVPAIVALLLAISSIPNASLADHVALDLGVATHAGSDASVFDDVPHAFRVEVTGTGCDPAEFTSFGALAGGGEFAGRIGVAADVGLDAEGRVVLAFATADVLDAVPLAHVAGCACGGFGGPAAGFIADAGLGVPFAVVVLAACIDIGAVEDAATGAAAVSGVVEDTKAWEGEADGGAE